MSSASTLPLLIPRPRRPVISVVPAPQSIPTQHEWEALYSEIGRLYVRERRKLRYIMQYMDREHGFKATEQMYKKRFAKWGFQKNSRRSAAVALTLTTKKECRRGVSREPNPTRDLGSIPVLPGLCHHDSLMLMFLTNARMCSMAFFESEQSRDASMACSHQLLPGDHQWPDNIKEISFAFKLVIDLLDRGHGNLAGRTARKAFLLVEDILTIEGPALVWNLLEMMHYMVTLHHTQLFQMLLAHLIALVDGRIPKTHPLSAMLHGLRGLVSSLTNPVSSPDSPSPTSSSSSSSSPSPSTSDDRTTTTTRSWLVSSSISSLLERGWILNAELVFDHFDPRLFHLYCRIHWDSCSINPPTTIFGAADQWYSQVGAQQLYIAAAEASRAESLLEITHLEEEKMLQRLLAPRMDASPPQGFEILRASCLAALRERGDSILSKRVGFTGHTATLLRLLAGLVTVKILEKWPTVIERLGTVNDLKTSVPRVHAEHLACAVRTLMDLNLKHGGEQLGAPSEAVEEIRSIVALREYARGETDPQVVQEMLLLKDLLAAAGEYKQAQEVGRNALHRLEKYTRDIPVDAA